MIIMKLDEGTNYIVSGLERSGTSMIMQILNAGDIPVSYDDIRKPDDDNPRGYFELEGGKIINRLIEGVFPFELYRGKFIKITSYGLKFLPEGKYKIIYSERFIDEIIDSMEKMIGKQDKNHTEIKNSIIKLNDMIKKNILSREDVDVLFLNYNSVLIKPEKNIKKILSFLKIKYNKNIVKKMVDAIDINLYRPRLDYCYSEDEYKNNNS
jgi:hypothetical protein